VDKTDQEILKLLIKNPTESFSSIAETIGVSVQTVIKRYNSMKKEQIISGENTIVNLSRLGFSGKVFLLIKGSINFDSTVVTEKVSSLPNVFLTSEMVGSFDLLAMALVKSVADIKDLINIIDKMPGVKKVEFTLTTDTTFPVTEHFANIKLFED
jgi:DNA-binding Lrp family transcriptional regulator